MKSLSITSLALVALWVTGCARYEYDIVNPPDLARHIGEKHDEVVQAGPLEYRMRSYESRLVVDVFNPTGDPVTLAGERSFVVAPNGQSHPFRTQTIGPSAFVKLILPPMRPYYRAGGPTIGFGVGVGLSRGRYGPGYSRFGAIGYDEPQYFTYYDESDATYWTWEGETDARVHLMYQAGGRELTHEFVFHRRKM
jgi:hypothetical protein